MHDVRIETMCKSVLDRVRRSAMEVDLESGATPGPGVKPGVEYSNGGLAGNRTHH